MPEFVIQFLRSVSVREFVAAVIIVTSFVVGVQYQIAQKADATVVERHGIESAEKWHR